MRLIVSPHNDDEALFCSFLVMGGITNPGGNLVVVAYDSVVQPSRGHEFAGIAERRQETLNAMKVMGAGVPYFLGIPDTSTDAHELETALNSVPIPALSFTEVFVPAVEDGGNAHHNLVGQVCKRMFGGLCRHYATYTWRGKSTSTSPIPYEPWMLVRKLSALACYTSQITIPDTRPHFARSQEEYLLLC